MKTWIVTLLTVAILGSASPLYADSDRHRSKQWSTYQEHRGYNHERHDRYDRYRKHTGKHDAKHHRHGKHFAKGYQRHPLNKRHWKDDYRSSRYYSTTYLSRHHDRDRDYRASIVLGAPIIIHF